MKFFTNIKQFPNPLASIILILIFLIAGLFHYIFYNMEIDYHKSKLQEVDTMEANAIWEVVESTIKSTNYIAEVSAIHAANHITNDIKEKYDADSLKQRLDKGTLEDSEIVGLLYDNMKENYLYKINNNRNALFVLTNNGYVIRPDSKYENDKGKIAKSKEDELNEMYNRPLGETSLYLLSKHDVGRLIFYEPEFTIDNPNHLMINNPSLDELKKVYNAEGLDGLSGYVILVPIYVTNDGDVFGTPDISPTGEIIKNYKLIVVQRYSLIDAINYTSKDEIDAIRHETYLLKRDIMHAINLRTLSYTAIMLLDIFALLIILYYSSFNLRRK